MLIYVLSGKIFIECNIGFNRAFAKQKVGEGILGGPFRGGTKISEPVKTCYPNRPLRSGGRGVMTERFFLQAPGASPKGIRRRENNNMDEFCLQREFQLRSSEISFWHRACEARPWMNPMLLLFSRPNNCACVEKSWVIILGNIGI